MKLSALSALSPIPGAAMAYFVSASGDWSGTADELFTNRTFTTPTVSGALIFTGTTPSFTLASNVLAVHTILPFSSTITVAASKQFDHIRLSKTDGGYNVFTIGAAGEVDGLNYQIQAASGSHATSMLHGVTGAVSNAGPGSTKALYGRAIAETGSTGVIVAGVFAAVPVSTSSTAWILQMAGGADYVDAAAYIHADDGVSANFNDGIVFDMKVRMESGGSFLKAFQTSGHDGDFLNYCTQAAAVLFKVDKDGNLTAPNVERILASVSLNLNSALTQTVYTVPAGKKLIITKAIAHTPSVDISAFAQFLAITQSQTGQNAVDLIGSLAAAFPDQIRYVVLYPTNLLVVNATEILRADFESALGTPGTLKIDLFGYLV